MDNDTMVAVTLKPCPWCGGEASADGYTKYSKPLADTWWEGGAPITEAFFVNCMKCGAVSRSGLVSGYQTKAEAIERWNTRHQSGRTGAGEHPDLAGHIADAVRDACNIVIGKVVSFDDSRGIANTILDRIRIANAEYAALSQSTAGEDAP